MSHFAGLPVAAALLSLVALPAAAASAPIEVQWNELAPMILGQTVSVALSGGAVVQGEAVSVRDASLALNIRKTSDSRAYPRGEASLPRTAIVELRLVETRGVGGRVLGTVVGAIVGMVGGAELAVHSTNTEGPAVAAFTSVAVSSAVGGYYTGRMVDRHIRVIRIAPPSGGN